MNILEHYINQFLINAQDKITGNCLIIKPDTFNLKYLSIRLPENIEVLSINKFRETKRKKMYKTIIAINLFNKVLNYDKALDEVFNLLDKNGYLMATLNSITDSKGNVWGFTLPSTKILFSRYFSKNKVEISTYGNALAGRYLIENREVLTSYQKAKLNITDIHFGLMVGFVGQKTSHAKKTKSKPINILVDEDKNSLTGHITSVLKRTSLIFDRPINTLRSIRGKINRILYPINKYLQSENHEPLTKNYGYSRGKPIDRYYIEKFLDQNKNSISGKCLEIVDNTYTLKFGGKHVTQADALDIFPSQRANIRGDLRNLVNIKGNSYDCLIITQTFFLIDDYLAAIKESHRILKPGGVLLSTLSTMSPSWNVSVNMWRFSVKSAAYVFGKFFGSSKVKVKVFGNKISSLGFWLGFSQEDIGIKKLRKIENDFPLIVGVIAKK